jgi:hypothetical protein
MDCGDVDCPNEAPRRTKVAVMTPRIIFNEQFPIAFPVVCIWQWLDADFRRGETGKMKTRRQTIIHHWHQISVSLLGKVWA